MIGVVRWLRLVVLAAGAILLAGHGAIAQAYPSKPIIIVVPFAPNGPTDTVARIIVDVMAKSLGEPVVIQNVGGAGGTLGSDMVASASPDGYTLLLHNIGMATAPTLYRRLPFSPTSDFTPVGLITDAPMTLVARPDFPPNTLSELIDYVRQHGSAVSIAHAGIGSASHLCGMLFMDAIDTKLTTAPYNGTGPVMADIVRKQIDMTCDQTTNTIPQIKGGLVKAYAVTTPKRLASLPDLPTAREAGLQGFEIASWHGLYGPAGMPEEVVAKLEAALQSALADPKVIERFAELGTVPVDPQQATPGALAQLLAQQIDLWRPIIENAGAYAD